MPTRPWDSILTDQDRAVIAKAGYGRARGLGTRPILVAIDCQYNFVGDDRPIVEQQHAWPAAGGDRAWSAVRRISGLLDLARSCRVPVLYTRNVQKRTLFNSFSGKSARDHTPYLDGSEGSRIVTEISPRDDDLVLDKSYASAFLGTPLSTWLVMLSVDTLLLTGVSTSGCVRATAVDAVSHGFRCAVVEDAVADRIDVSHRVALLDLWMKYCDLLDSAAAADYLAQHRP